jgi:hypothetical protein
VRRATGNSLEWVIKSVKKFISKHEVSNSITNRTFIKHIECAFALSVISNEVDECQELFAIGNVCNYYFNEHQ